MQTSIWPKESIWQGDGNRGVVPGCVLFDQRQQFVSFDGFGGSIIATGRDAFLAIAGHCVSGECDDGPVETVGPQKRGGLVAVHLGHLHVHQHDIIRCAVCCRTENCFHGQASVFCDFHVCAGSA